MPRPWLDTVGAFADLIGQTDMRSVSLYGRKAAGRVALVDDEDYDWIMERHWRVQEQMRNGRVHGPYAIGHMRQGDGTWKPVRMHKLITGWPLTDHINHDTLDNRRFNLRPATDRQSSQNRRPFITAASAYKGITWNRQHRKWLTRIGTSTGRMFLGLFTDEVEAARAYDAAARELFGEYAYLNFPDA